MSEQPWGGPLWAAADLITPMALRVAATLRVADAIAGGVTTGPALAERLGVAADPLVRVLRHLVTAGYLRDDDGGFALTDTGEWLRDDHPQGIRAWLDIEGSVGRAELSAVDLLHTVRTAEAAYPQRYGRPYWEDIAGDPARAASFNALMGAGMSADAPAIATAYDWAALGDVVDVGGGDGSLLIALQRAHPALTGAVVDLPAAADTARTAIEAAGLADRGRAVAGSFFDPLPPGAGGYVLSRIICDWDDDESIRILRNCADAARPSGGKVLVIEEGGAGLTSTEMDLRMLIYVLGRERTLDALLDLAHTAGLTLGSVTPVGHRAIIELAPLP
jgi:SAM-dependent methyltransferase